MYLLYILDRSHKRSTHTEGRTLKQTPCETHLCGTLSTWCQAQKQPSFMTQRPAAVGHKSINDSPKQNNATINNKTFPQSFPSPCAGRTHG